MNMWQVYGAQRPWGRGLCIGWCCNYWFQSIPEQKQKPCWRVDIKMFLPLAMNWATETMAMLSHLSFSKYVWKIGDAFRLPLVMYLSVSYFSLTLKHLLFLHMYFIIITKMRSNIYVHHVANHFYFLNKRCLFQKGTN